MSKIELPKVKWTVDHDSTFRNHHLLVPGYHPRIRKLWLIQDVYGTWLWGVELVSGTQYAAYHGCPSYREARKKALTWLVEQGKRPIRLARRCHNNEMRYFLCTPDQKHLA